MRKKIFGLMLSAMLFALYFPAQGQQPAKVPRIGMLQTGAASTSRDLYGPAFLQSLRDLGYEEGGNIVVEYRYAEGINDRLPELAAGLVRSKVDIIVATGDPGARAAKNATKTIPIVMVTVRILSTGTDPVETGLVESLARPGGNITGLTHLAVGSQGPLGQGEMAGKRLELFKEAVPKIASIAVLHNPAERGNLTQLKGVQTAARPLGLTVQSWGVRDADGFDRAFAALRKERSDGLFVAGGALMNANAKRIADFALKNRLPSVYARRESVDAGGLMSYDADRVDQYRRAAIYVDKILKGAKPADIPVERATKFELVINLKTAKQIGLTIPPNVLARADKVIK